MECSLAQFKQTFMFYDEFNKQFRDKNSFLLRILKSSFMASERIEVNPKDLNQSITSAIQQENLDENETKIDMEKLMILGLFYCNGTNL